MTGEIGVAGEIRPVGGVPIKIDAARRAGLSRVLIPRANWMERFAQAGLEVVAVETLEEAISVFWPQQRPLPAPPAATRGCKPAADLV